MPLIKTFAVVAVVLVIVKVVRMKTIDTKEEDSVCVEKMLPSQCKYISYQPIEGILNMTQTRFVCTMNRGGFENSTVERLARIWTNCSKLIRESQITLIIKHHSNVTIVDRSFRSIIKIGHYKPKYMLSIEFYDLKGFDIGALFGVNFNRILFETDFNLYRRGRIIKDCKDFINSNSSGFIFYSSSAKTRYINEMSFLRPNNKYSICSLFFREAKINRLAFSYMIHSFYLKRLVSFTDPPIEALAKNQIDFNSQISSFNILDSYGLEINSRLLNPNIFAQTFEFHLICDDINSIDEHVFGSFKSIKRLFFNQQTLIVLFRKQGVAWLKSINSNVNIDVRESKLLIDNYEKLVSITFHEDIRNVYDPQIRFAYDQDLCLYKDFPFNQMIFFRLESEKGLYFFRQNYFFNCAELWILQFMLIFEHRIRNDFKNDFYYLKLNSSNWSSFTACHFERRFDLCRKSSFKVVKNNSNSLEFAVLDFVYLSEFLLTISTTLCSAFGILTNLSVVLVIFHKENAKTMRDKHYIYMCLHCLCNIIIFFTQILNLMNECQFVGFYCSSIHRIVGVQYVKIIFGEYLNNVSRLMANFTYFGFSVCRMSRVGKKHGKFIEEFNKTLRIKKYVGMCLLVSAGLSVCKALRFEINIDKLSLPFPNQFGQNTMRTKWNYVPKYVVISVINGIYDLLNYVVFVLVHLVVDLVLLKKLRLVFQEKEAKLRQMKRAGELEKALNETEDSKRRAIIMVIANSIFNLVTKVPLIITSLNDLRLIALENPDQKNVYKGSYFMLFFRTTFSLRVFCSLERSCLLFQSFSNFLFILSSSLVLFYLKSFDMNFKIAFRFVFSRK